MDANDTFEAVQQKLAKAQRQLQCEFIDTEIATKRNLSKNGMLQKIEAFRAEVECKKRKSLDQQGGLLQKIETFRTEVERKKKERGE